MRMQFAILPVTFATLLFAAAPSRAQVIADLRGDYVAAAEVGNT